MINTNTDLEKQNNEIFNKYRRDIVKFNVISEFNYDKLKSSLYGFIVGDAIGVPLEFTERNNTNQKNDKMLSFGTHHVPAGTWSDDTSMTLATLDSLVKNRCLVPEDIMQRFCNWYSNASYTNNGKLFDIGNTTASAIRKYISGSKRAIECGQNDIKSNGNGSLMRIMPIAFYLHSNYYDYDEASVKVTNDISSLTHSHEISRLGCYIYVRYIMELLNGKDKFEAYADICKYNYEKYYSKESIEKYSMILDGKLQSREIDEIKSTGYIISSLEASLWSVLTTTNFKDSIIKSINLGNDTDTIGAITGSLSGIIYGYEDIPSEWIDTIYNKEIVDNILNVLYDQRERVDEVCLK